MKLSEMRELLSGRGIQLTKSLGQNFLHDANQLERIVAAGVVKPGDHILEIGPGLGPLTEKLLEHGAEVFAIEKDRRLSEFLRERFAQEPRLKLVEDDALAYVRSSSRDWSDWKLVANLPYSVASPILVELATGLHAPERLVATLQLEVAERIAAAADTEHYGLLSLFLQLNYEARGYFKIPRSCFFPEPDVDSACVQLIRREEKLLPPEQFPVFQRVVKLAFSARRKMMAKLLKQQWPADLVSQTLDALGISPQARAETVPLEAFVAMTRRFCECNGDR
jgi:16S rRNA (adenine1518-N6/adenine1519-N6)-dimethyltransferase